MFIVLFSCACLVMSLFVVWSAKTGLVTKYAGEWLLAPATVIIRPTPNGPNTPHATVADRFPLAHANVLANRFDDGTEPGHGSGLSNQNATKRFPAMDGAALLFRRRSALRPWDRPPNRSAVSVVGCMVWGALPRDICRRRILERALCRAFDITILFLVFFSFSFFSLSFLWLLRFLLCEFIRLLAHLRNDSSTSIRPRSSGHRRHSRPSISPPRRPASHHSRRVEDSLSTR